MPDTGCRGLSVSQKRLPCSLGQTEIYDGFLFGPSSGHKRGQFVSRERQFVQRPLLVRIMDKAVALRDMSAAMLFLAAYVFFLRVPSEGIPMRKGGRGVDVTSTQSVITLEGEQVRT